MAVVSSILGTSAAHTHDQLYSLQYFSFSFVSVKMHGGAYLRAHNGELLGAILGMSEHCCMFSYWGFLSDSS